ncbi:hypothetical protein HK097_003917 [Rhizophlyctis rosea]|uniref:Alpha/beta-hydrolase n=1 Tax=Rhizophlyctis rosea TaxID=64517 RepID=A0AAD5SGD1_9FUNG|nr:hypothetical protein HK097_003917 [Rhizophlyctis rosea]
MKFAISAVSILAILTPAWAQGAGKNIHTDLRNLTGPYAPSRYFTDSSLQRHTIYQPRTVPSGASFPILVWGEGACAADGTAVQNFLHNIASYGFVVIANGNPGGSGTTSASWLTESLDWVSQKAGSSGYQHYDKNRIAAAGWSCGGLEAYEMRSDSRVKSIGIFNSGQFDQSSTNRVVPQVRVPIFFFLGGPSDIAYNNDSPVLQGERDYDAVSSGIPKWKGNLNVGHGATYYDQNGGKFGTAAANWLSWVLKGDSSAASFFTGNGAQSAGWNVEYANLGNIQGGVLSRPPDLLPRPPGPPPTQTPAPPPPLVHLPLKAATLVTVRLAGANAAVRDTLAQLAAKVEALAHSATNG